jgi:hypothetical protein
VATSPILSLDGTKVAFVESISSGSVLHILRPVAGEGTVAVPVVPTIVTSTGTTWTSCLAGSGSCMFNLTYNTAANTNSSPYYLYSDDTLFVGDDNGKLYKITGVFAGTPAVPWTATVNSTAGTKVTSPVVDYSTGKIFVGDSLGKISSFLTSNGAATGTPITTSLSSMTDGPILDGSTGKLHFFGLSSTTPKVVQTDTSLSTPVVATIGGTGAAQIHAGTFNNTYYNSVDGTGTLYVCGHVSTTANTPTLYSIALTSGAMATSTTGSLSLGTGTGECSPMTEINNSGTDWLFVGIPSLCAFGGSSTGCVESFNITSGFPATAAATGDSSGGTSGIVVDNVSASGHASSLYYSTLSTATCTTPTGTSATGGCAVQRTHSGLQ